MQNNIYEPDGHFEYDGKTIYYRIVDNGQPIRKIKGIEKFGRDIQYADSRRFVLYTHHIYGKYEEMTNLDSFMIEGWFLENLDKVRWNIPTRPAEMEN